MTAPESSTPDRVGTPRWLLLVFSLAVFLVVYPVLLGVVPWALSLLTPRNGWTDGQPALGNWPGLLPVLAGAAGLLWVMATSLSNWHRVPDRVDVAKGTPPFLVLQGPFAFSRNPIYVSAVFLLAGWTLFYGSPAVLVELLIVVVVVCLLVPREERTLEAEFGEEFRAFKARVPRWLGFPRR